MEIEKLAEKIAERLSDEAMEYDERPDGGQYEYLSRSAASYIISEELRRAVAAEREACARVAEQSRTSYFDEDGVCNNPGADIAALIRKRK